MPTSQHTVAPKGPLTAPHTVLLVLDDDALGELLESILSDRPCVSHRVGSLAAARALMAATAVDAVVLDGVLPDGLGLELARECGGHERPPRFAFLSA